MAKKDQLYSCDLGPDDKKAFLELLRDGTPKDVAGRECGSTATQFKHLRNPRSAFYDRAFAEEWAAIEMSADFQRALDDRVRDMVWNKADEGFWPAIKMLAVTRLQEFEWQKHQNFTVDVKLRAIQEAVPTMSVEQLEELRRHLLETEKKPLKALPAPEAA